MRVVVVVVVAAATAAAWAAGTTAVAVLLQAAALATRAGAVARAEQAAAQRATRQASVPPGRKSPKPKNITAETFVSPAVEDLTFEQAAEGFRSRRQKVLLQICEGVDARLGLRERKQTSVIGAWTEGAENSVMMTSRGNRDAILASAVIKGAVTNQKSVLVFEPKDDGPQRMYDFELSGGLAEIHDRLLQAGIQNHTLEPTEGGAKVHVLAMDAESNAAAVAFIDAADVDSTRTAGDGEFPGYDPDKPGSDAKQRADAQRAYAAIIERLAGSETLSGRDIRAIWRDADNHWRAETAEAGAEPRLGGSEGHPSLVSTACYRDAGTLESDHYQRADLEHLRSNTAAYEKKL